MLLYENINVLINIKCRHMKTLNIIVIRNPNLQNKIYSTHTSVCFMHKEGIHAIFQMRLGMFCHLFCTILQAQIVEYT